MKKIVFVFKEDGTVTTEASGFEGSACVKATEDLLRGLDSKLESRKVKGEFYVHEKAKTETRATV